MKYTHYILLTLLSFMWISATAQKDARPLIEKGNSYYENQDYKNAAVQYKHACQLDSLSYDAWYNFGNALYNMQKYILATEAYDKAMKLTSDKKLKASILHNVGNISCDQGKYDKAVNLYKQSLLLNPQDDSTRYNLAFAQEKLKIQEMMEKLNEQTKKDKEKDKPKPSEFAEECLKKAQELVQQFKFEDALKVMQDGAAKDKSVELFNDFIQKLQGITQIIIDNKE